MEYSKDDKEKYPILSLLQSNGLEDYTLESTFNSDDIDDIDSIYIVIESEKLYDVHISDDEAELILNKHYRIVDLHNFITFIKGGECDPIIYDFILKNLSEIKDIRPIYKSFLRDLKIDELLS
jgi:acyl carrier protein